MSHSAIHVAIGMATGSLLVLPWVFAAWLRGRPLARPFAAWLIACYGLGAFAVLPSVLTRVGLPARFLSFPWMNLFLLHPLIRRSHPGGDIVAAAGILTGFALQYVLLIAAILYRRHFPVSRAHGTAISGR